MIDEEAIYYALASLMVNVRWTVGSDTLRFQTVSRKVKLFSDVDPSAQPACYQAEWATDEQQRTNMPYKTTLAANWIIYHYPGKEDDSLGSVVNNQILKGVRSILAPLPTDMGFLDKRNTLGGLVYHCFIQGRIFKDPGDIDGQAMMVVPIKLLVP